MFHIRYACPQMEGASDEGLASRVRALETKARESDDIIRTVNRIIEESARYGKLQELQKKHGISNYQ